MDFRNRKVSVYTKVGIYCAIFCTVFNLYVSVTLAGPEGTQVVNGQVSIQQSGYNTTIVVSDKAIINYSSFDIATPEVVEFIQPNCNSSVLNRILSANPTNINGTLFANGRVFFVNPAGVFFGNGARINVAQLVASSLNISNSDFINGQYNFAGGTGSVVNRGDISAEEVYLIGKQVANYGNIDCPAGFVVMASGDKIFLGEAGSDVVVEIDVPSLPGPERADPIEGCGVLNEGTVEVGDGVIILAAAGDIYSQAISNVGTLSASSNTGDAGQVKLTATDSTVINSGSIKAKSNSGNGGTVKMFGDKVGLLDAGQIDVCGSNGGGTVLVGGDYQGKGDVPTASRTYVSPDSTIKADATENGDGGKVIVWADEITSFYGDVSARGGANGGNGGFVEISSKDNLGFYGYVNTLAPQGNTGILLLDPTNLTIVNGGPDTGSLDGSLPDVLFADGGSDESISELSLEALNTNIILQATQDIILNDLTDNVLNLSNLNTESLVIQAGRHITFNSTGDTITTAGGTIHLEADSPHTGGVGAGDGIGKLTLGNLNSNGGDITLIGAPIPTGGTEDTFVILGVVNAGNGDITVGTSTNAPLILAKSKVGGVLSDAEIDNFISNGVLRIGEVTTKGIDGAGTGAVTLTATSITTVSNSEDFSPAHISTLHLKSSGGVTASKQALIVPNLAIEAAGEVKLSSSRGDVDTLAIYTSTGNIQFDDAGSFSVGTVDGIAGVSTDNGTVKLTAARLGSGNLTVTDTAATDDVFATSGLTLQCNTDEGKITIDAGADVECTGGTNYYKADKMDIAGTITATGQKVTLMTKNGVGTDPVNLGSIIDTTANTLELSDAELDHIIASELRFGDSGKAGAITVSTDISPANITTTLRLISDSTVTINGRIDTLTAGKGCAVQITNAGLLDIAPGADMTLDGSFLQDGAGPVQTAGDITTTGDNITFNSPVTLTDSHSVTFGTGAGVGGNIAFQNTLDGTTDFTEDLNLTAGTGNIDFDGIVGGTKDLGNVTIVSAADVTTDAVFNANTLTQQAGTGYTQFDGAVTLNDTGGMQLTTNTVAINNAVNTSNGGIVTITNAGLLDIAAGADMILDGAFTQNGAGAVQTAGDITTTGDNITFGRAVTLTDGHLVAFSTGEGVGGNIAFQSTLDGTTDFAEGLSLTAGTGNIDFGGIVGGTKDLGNVTINSADDVHIQAALNANNIVITASDTTIDIDDDITAAVDIELNSSTDVADGVTLTAGNDLKLGAGKTITGEGDLTLVATAGGMTEKAGDDGKFQINMVADNKTLTLTQNDALNIDNLSVTNDEDTVLVATSTGSTITSTAAGSWKSIAANASGDLTLTNLNNNDTITIGNLTSGGEIWVQSIADLTTPDGVTLTAGGTYNTTANDDRSRVYFRTDDEPIDVAIYLGSYDFTNRTGGNVTINSAVSMTNNGTMVIDAYDTVSTFGSNFTSSASWSNSTNRLEVVSRISQSLDDAINKNRLPYALEARGGGVSSWFNGEKYLLRGRGLLAEVLVAVGAVPIVSPISFKLESRGGVEWPDIDIEAVLQSLSEELGEQTIQMYIEGAYLGCTDIQLYKIAARLMNLAEILKHANLTGPSSLVAVVNEFVREPLPSEKQIASIESAMLQHRGDGTHFDRAGEWLDALANYVSTLNTEFGWSYERSIGFVMAKYGPELDLKSTVFVEMYLRSLLAINNEQHSQ